MTYFSFTTINSNSVVMQYNDFQQLINKNNNLSLINQELYNYNQQLDFFCNWIQQYHPHIWLEYNSQEYLHVIQNNDKENNKLNNYDDEIITTPEEFPNYDMSMSLIEATNIFSSSFSTYIKKNNENQEVIQENNNYVDDCQENKNYDQKNNKDYDQENNKDYDQENKEKDDQKDNKDYDQENKEKDDQKDNKDYDQENNKINDIQENNNDKDDNNEKNIKYLLNEVRECNFLQIEKLIKKLSK